MSLKSKHISSLSFNPFRLTCEDIFTNKMIFNLLYPILIEQIAIILIGIMDTMMVSYVGEAAVAGISLVNTFQNFVKVLMSGLAVGSSVVISQYIGRKSLNEANKALKMSYYSVFALSVVMALAFFIFKEPILSLIAGNAEYDVMKNARTFFLLSLYSLPFFSAIYVATASFRAMGNTGIPMACNICLVFLNITLKAIFIYIFEWGVMGAALSTLISAAVTGIIATFLLIRPKSIAYIDKIFKFDLEFNMIRRILKIGIPNSIESGMFNIGLFMVQRLTISFGTASIAAHAILSSVVQISNIVGMCFGLVVVTVVGQCMGAGKPSQAVMYLKHILKINYILTFFICMACIIFNKTLIGSFNISDESKNIASNIFYMYCIGTIFIYPTSYILPNALRASGDTKFTMIASISSMFGLRIGLAYVFGRFLNMGLFGIWLAMQIDWMGRSALFIIRFIHGKWKKIKVI